jgi:hypothetical protein
LTEQVKQGHLRQVQAVSYSAQIDTDADDGLDLRIAVDHAVFAYPFSARLEKGILLGM